MNSIDRDLYALMVKNYSDAASDALDDTGLMLRRLCLSLPLEDIANALFITCLALFIWTLDRLVLFTVLTGMGAILAAWALIFASDGWRRAKAFTGLLANMIFVMLL